MSDFKNELSSLLMDPEFLPNGGYLGFGLEYAYAISNYRSKLSDLENRLKGVDAGLMQAFKELSLVTSFWSVVEYGYNMFACEDRIPGVDSVEHSYFEYSGQNFRDWIVTKEGALILKSDIGYSEVNIRINWVKKLVKAQWGKQSFVNYGNESYTDHVYHNVCLVAKVGKPGRRGIPESPAPIWGEDNFGDEDQSAEEGHDDRRDRDSD